MTFCKRQNYTDGERFVKGQGLRKNLTVKGQLKGIWGSDRNILYLDHGGDYMTLYISQNSELNTKQVHYSRCKIVNIFFKFSSLLISSIPHVPSLGKHTYF